jgi:hypothetical protein
MAVCSEIHTKHINTLCGQNVELLNVELAVHILTTGIQVANLYNHSRDSNIVKHRRYSNSGQALLLQIQHTNNSSNSRITRSSNSFQPTPRTNSVAVRSRQYGAEGAEGAEGAGWIIGGSIWVTKTSSLL